jgi:SAM-dependent methyltransferase
VLDDFTWYQDQTLLELITNAVPATCKRALDIGCGTGNVLRYLGDRRKDVRWIGIDLAPEMVAKARLKCEGLGNVLVEEMDWKELRRTFEPSGFDVILLKNVLHLTADTTEHLAMLPSLLSATGRILVVETVSPNGESKQFISSLAVVLKKVGIKKHVFTARDLVRSIRKAGLDLSKLQFHDQFIEVMKWIEAKALSREVATEALKYFQSEMRSDTLRTSMKYDPPSSSYPGKMLRRQMVIQCIPKFDSKLARHSPTP